MAKSKAPLTPEQAEVKQIKKEKRAANFNSFLAILLAVVLTFGVVAVAKTTAEKKIAANGNESAVENTAPNNIGGGSIDDEDFGDYLVDSETGEIILDENGEPVINDGTQGDNVTQSPGRELPENPAEWTKAEIVNFYKKSAQNSTGNKSIQKMTMDNGMDVTLNNGALEFVIGAAEPVIKLALKANSTEFDGITGGYNKLVPSDVESAKAYKDGNDTVIEMTMVEQIDDAYGDTFSGTVGHAISVVGNIAVVADAFPNWTINFKDAFVQLHYVNPKLKVRINDKGVITKGTWSYVVKVEVRDLQIENVVVKKATTDINYVITTGGGF